MTTLIYEGFPLTKRLHNELDYFYGHFEVDLADDSQAILLDLINTEGRVGMYVKYEGLPQTMDYDWKHFGSGVVHISPKDKAYHKTGTYYVMILPDFNFLDIFIDNYYTFSLTWRTEDSMPHLNPQRL